MRIGIKYLAKPGLMAIFTIIVLSCENEVVTMQEHNTNNVQTTPGAILEAWFSLDNFNDPAGTVKNNIQIQWENHNAKTIDETFWYEFGIIQKQKTDMVSPFQENNQYKLLARLDEDNKPHYFIAKLAPQPFTVPQEFSYLNPEGFSGTVSLYNLQGEVVFLEYYKKGQVQNTVRDISVKEESTTPISNKCMQKGTAMAKCDTALECAFALAEAESTGGGCGSGGNAGGSYVAVRTDHYTDWYNIRSNGTTDYSHTQFNGSTYEYIYVTDTNYSSNHQTAYSYYVYTGHGDYGAAEEGYYTDTPPSAEQPERIIIALKDKEACINKLLMKNGGNYIDQILQHFQGEESEFDIKIESKDKVFRDGEGVHAKTKPPSNGIITIQISTYEASDTPALAVAKTILHEYIHADMFRKLNTKYPTSGDLDFKETYEAFIGTNFNATPQHETMAELYVDEMVAALKNFHENVLIGDYNYLSDNGTISLDNFYEALAWQGLKEHNVQAYKDLPDERKQELEEAINLFYHGSTKDCPKN